MNPGSPALRPLWPGSMPTIFPARGRATAGDAFGLTLRPPEPAAGRGPADPEPDRATGSGASVVCDRTAGETAGAADLAGPAAAHPAQPANSASSTAAPNRRVPCIV